MHQISMLDCIYALKESDRSEGRFRPAFETAEAVWNFEIEDFDKLGLLILGLAVRSKSPPRLSLLQQSDSLVEKVTYLEEDFKLVEHDRDTDTSILRSQLPHRVENTLDYYEIVLKGGDQLSFHRYSFDRIEGKRQRSAANLARIIFERLLADFESVLS